MNKKTDTFPSLMVVVTTNILVKLRQSRDMQPRVKRLVLLPPEEQVCSVVRRKRRIRRGSGPTGWRHLSWLNIEISNWCKDSIAESLKIECMAGFVDFRVPSDHVICVRSPSNCPQCQIITNLQCLLPCIRNISPLCYKWIGSKYKAAVIQPTNRNRQTASITWGLSSNNYHHVARSF